jgi:hypothetical protein
MESLIKLTNMDPLLVSTYFGKTPTVIIAEYNLVIITFYLISSKKFLSNLCLKKIFNFFKFIQNLFLVFSKVESKKIKWLMNK